MASTGVLDASLSHLFSGQVVVVADDAEEWDRAYEAWLAPKPASTQRAYRRAWDDLLAFVVKAPWEIQSGDVREWLADLQQRPLDERVRKGLERCRGRRAGSQGLAASSINQYLAAVSSFYAYVGTAHLVATTDGRERPLFEGPNPTRGAVVKRPKVGSYDRSSYLDVEQLRALLQAIRSEIRHNPIQTARDYALFLTYIATGRRSYEIRTLRWGDIQIRGGQRVYYDWANKGKSGRNELPTEAWSAVEEYLRLAGRWNAMVDGDYIFVPLSDNILRLRREGEPLIDAETWTRNRPLSAREVGRLLKRYARLAGLESEQIHVHTLRHSAAMLRLEANGGDVVDLQQLLGHSSLAVTSIYVHKVRGRHDVSWAKAAALLGL